MEGAFGKETMERLHVSCSGSRPWLEGNATEGCDLVPRAVQRGASNLYFPVVASALAIPPFTESIQVRLDQHWHRFESKPPEKWPDLIHLLDLDKELGMTADQIIAEVNRAKQALQSTGIPRIRFEEYEKLCGQAAFGDQVDFDVRDETVPPALARYFEKIVRVVRLREVRAIRGFTRIVPPSGELEEDAPSLAKLSLTPKRWLPAIEVKGEGIFIKFKQAELAQWENNPGLKPLLDDRAGRVNVAYAEAWKSRYGSHTPPPRIITPRLLLVHSFAHALIRRLTISCGYSSASLRERLYVDSVLGMAGMLVYTATPDSDGSLGGLERQGKQDRMRDLVPSAIRDMEWCSNDPLCIQDISTFSDSQNLAACHACMMVPETSCEEFNVLLDRAMLVGVPGNKELGFFSSLLNPLSQI